MQPINIAIAGAGFSSRVFHIPFLKQDARFNIVKVYERTSNNAAEWLRMQKQCGISTLF